MFGSGWLIEGVLEHIGVGWYAVAKGPTVFWTTNQREALQLAREQDATSLIRLWGLDGAVAVQPREPGAEG